MYRDKERSKGRRGKNGMIKKMERARKGRKK
jgi:hypothetical protein